MVTGKVDDEDPLGFRTDGADIGVVKKVYYKPDAFEGCVFEKSTIPRLGLSQFRPARYGPDVLEACGVEDSDGTKRCTLSSALPLRNSRYTGSVLGGPSSLDTDQDRPAHHLDHLGGATHLGRPDSAEPTVPSSSGNAVSPKSWEDQQATYTVVFLENSCALSALRTFLVDLLWRELGVCEGAKVLRDVIDPFGRP